MLVAHALGGIDREANTNSLEALRCNHARGFRWFEVDLALTRDQQLVAFQRGHEKHASLHAPIGELSFTEIEQARYRGKFAIPRLADVLDTARSLGDVVLVLDPKSWRNDIIAALQRALGGVSEPRVVLQSYGRKDIKAVSRLAQEIGGSVILSLHKTRALDTSVIEMAKKYGAIAVVATSRRFTPWLARRLDEERVPVLVSTVNQHEQVVELTRAGADGFYTDVYVPYGVMAANREATLNCGATEASSAELRPWLERDLARSADYRSRSCATRQRGRVELAGCGPEAAISSRGLVAPPGSEVEVDLEVEAAGSGADVWFEVSWKDGSKADEPTQMRLASGERRTLTRANKLAAGSAGVEARLGLNTLESRLIVHRLKVTLKPEPGAGDSPVLTAPKSGG